jgi:hypothetical protein
MQVAVIEYARNVLGIPVIFHCLFDDIIDHSMRSIYAAHTYKYVTSKL